MILYKNGVPWTYYAGANDTPRDGVAPATLQTSPHTLLNMIKAPWGELNTPIAVTKGADITVKFGKEVFDIDNPHYNYQSVLAEWIGSQGTPQYLSRMELPGMAKSNGRLMIEIAENSFPIYEREMDGSFKKDGNGDKIPTGQWADGFLYRLVTENDIAGFTLGNGKQASNSGLVGKKVDRDADGNVASPGSETFTDTAGTKFPILDSQGRFMGALGDRILTELFAPLDTDAIAAKTATIEHTGQMMYRLGHFLQAKSGGGNSRIYGVAGETHADFTLKADQVNKAGSPISFEDQYQGVYALTEQTYTGANLDAPVSFHLYEDNIKAVLELFHAAELKAKMLDVNYPCWIHDEEVYSINLLEANDHYGVPYHALGVVGVTEQPVAGYYSPYAESMFAMKGGNDGDLSDTAYNTAVKNFCDNVEHMFPIHDMMQYQIGWVYDMGLSVDAKKSLYRLMDQNPSLIVVGAVEEFGVAPKDYNDTVATAIALESAYGLYPESVIYKTEPSRGLIVPYACKIKNHKYRKPVPLTFSLAKKMNDYIGYSTGIWNPSNDPMLERNKGIDEVLLNFQSLGLNRRNTFWVNQLVIVETIQHEVRGFTGLQTVNGNDSSVLNNLMVVAAVGQAVRAGFEAGVVFRGQTAPPSVIAQRHEERIIEECAGIDKSKARISVKSGQSTDDYNAGYAITDTITVSGFQSITAVTLELNTQYATEE